jgi:hypothetical protein
VSLYAIKMTMKLRRGCDCKNSGSMVAHNNCVACSMLTFCWQRGCYEDGDFEEKDMITIIVSFVLEISSVRKSQKFRFNLEANGTMSLQ